ncbi:histidine protein methyltransferase 1 homolog isoform X2 [Nilaparvata lugens]|uniref:histidine protein methyltransferase 1 homolog isoform X2 n=1 Tax=Nilaparvata lugens TaxID=108931 RepID=UPI000B98D2D9|nr:histidine protein methyltransferase 1 homolog isoform X2 [Nilaparvata lugens]
MSMFKFNFSNSEDNNVEAAVTETSQDKIIDSDLKWLPAVEIIPSNYGSELITEGKWLTKKISNSDNSIHYLSSESNNSKEIYKTDADIEEAQYEGGFKVWDCTYHLMNYLCENNPEGTFKGKKVLDLGCGNGFLGILSFYIGAEIVHFQDYNDSVINKITIPNTLKNLQSLNDSSVKCKFFAGDWESFSDLDDFKYDIILTAATIYNTKSYKKLLSVFKQKLELSGTVILAAKSHYFGWGGGTRNFEEFLQKDGSFLSRTLWTCSEGVQQDIIEIKFKSRDEFSGL